MPEKVLVEAVRDALDHAMDDNDDVVILGEDVGVEGGVFRATKGLQDEYGEDRVIDTPLAESGIIGTSIGMALNGLTPVPEIQFVGFAHYGFHQIQNHLSRFCSRSRGEFNLPVTIRSPYSGGIRALEHHEESPESLFAHIPGLQVVIPSGPYDAKGLLLSAIQEPNPVMFLEPARIYRAFREDVPDEPYTVPLGEAEVVQEGSDVTIITWGTYVNKFTPDAIETLEEEEDASIELIDLRSISPIDWETIEDSVEKTGRCVIVQEQVSKFSVASEIAAHLAENEMLHLEAPVERVHSPDVPFPLFAREDYFLPDAERIVAKARQVLNF